MTIAFFPAIAAISLPKIVFLVGLIGVFVLDGISPRFVPAPAQFVDFKCVVREFYNQN